MILFDGSGSMWGKIEGEKRPKFEVAREALREAIAKAPATSVYGLASFGHRRAADCTDIQVIAPPAAGDIARVLTPLDKLNPKGKGPIAGAIREIAKSFPPGNAGTILLIHDNADNCRMDPCEAIGEVVAANPKIRFHLVSVALEPADRDRMACVANRTGGKVFEAADAPALVEAVGNAVRLAMIDPSGAPAPAKAEDKSPEPAATAKVAAPPSLPPVPGLQLSARLGRDASVLDAPIRWIVRKGTTVVFETVAATPFARLDPGSYTVEATAGLTTANVKADVSGPSATPVTVPLEAAAVTIAVRDHKEANLSETATVSIRRSDGTEAGGARPLWIGRAPEAQLILPAGSYKVEVSDQMVSREETVTAAAGAILLKDVILGAGRLEVTPVMKSDGAPLDGITVLLSRDDPDAPDGRREVARSAAVRPSFVLPAGTYYVTARFGATSVRERIAVGAGDVIKRSIVIGVSKLQIAPSGSFARGTAVGPTGRIGLKTRLLSLDGPPREVARSTALLPEFQVAPGKYRIEAQAGAHNAKVQQDIEVEPGILRKVPLKLDAQTVVLKTTAAAEVTWEIRDASGGLVARSLDAMPSLVLAPGRYQVRAEIRDKALSGAFEVPAAGDPQVLTVELGPK